MLLESIACLLKSEERYKFSVGDPSFIGQKPETYSVDLFQQRELHNFSSGGTSKSISPQFLSFSASHNRALADVIAATSGPVILGLITESKFDVARIFV